MQKPADFRMPQCHPARQLPRRLDGYRDDYAHGLSCNGRSMRFRSIREAGWPAVRRQTARRGGAAAIGYPLRTVAVSTSFCRSIRRRAPCRRRFEQDPMALQNRVTPFGDIAAIPQRGMFTGNRGIIHDPATRTLLKRRWASKAWLTCLCEFKGRHREVMARCSWTELFLPDEAVALAAGHRPCFFCRREAAQAFRNAWPLPRGVQVTPATETADHLSADGT